MKYKCIFFDLDHTLWDYEANSRETLIDLYHHFGLKTKGVDSMEDFYYKFKEVNEQLWLLYDSGKIDSQVIRKDRFRIILEAFHAYEEQLSDNLSHEYLHACPEKQNLIPEALDTLHYLSGRYNLAVITNGFEEIQNRKLTAGNLHHFFGHIITSQRAGHRKPAREIFEYALKVNNIRPHEAIMVGDNLITDIGGARNASIDTAFFNPERVTHDERVNYEIRTLGELCQLL